MKFVISNWNMNFLLSFFERKIKEKERLIIVNTLKTCSTIAAEAIMEEKRRAMRKAWIGKGIVDLRYGNVFITTKELQVVDLCDL